MTSGAYPDRGSTSASPRWCSVFQQFFLGEERAVEVTTSERSASGGEPPKLPAENLVKAFYGVVDRLGDDLAIRDEARDKELSWNELRDTVHRIAGGLSQLGVKKGDTVAIMLGNRWEFIPCDLAAVSLGAIPFSVYQTYAPEQVEYLLSDAESKLVITEQAYLDNVNEARKGVSTLERVIVVDGDGGDLTLEELMEMDPEFDPAESVEQLGPDDLLTLIYTSGTTGPPKGVQLTHRNMLAISGSAQQVVDVSFGDRITSFLPSAHIADRASAQYFQAISGVQVTHIADPRTIAAALPDARPTIWFAVPRVWEKIKMGIEAKVAAEPDARKKKLAEWALAQGAAKARADLAGTSLGLPNRVQHAVADR